MQYPRVVATAAVAVIAIAVGAAILPEPLGPAPVVVELFTSQGCSSCPPAEALLSQLRGRRGVIPLAFHVDYWDHYGWRDPFSSRLWSQRQFIYVHAMHLNSGFTPQAVVNGSAQVVGSNQSGLERAIEEASHRPVVGSVSVDASRKADTIVANVRANAPQPYDILLAVFENEATTNIGAGENAGRTQSDTAIVRTLQRVMPGTVTLHVDPAWKDLGVAVFLQNRETLEIGNAALSAAPAR